jgi:tripartite motif-containing protein 37
MAMHQSFRTIIEHTKTPFERKESEISDRMSELTLIAEASQRCIADAEAALAIEDKDDSVAAIMGAMHDVDCIRDKFNKLTVSVVLPSIGNDEMVPPFESFEHRIPDFVEHVERFRGLAESECRYIYSKTMRLYDLKWRMKIFPSGNGSGLNTHVSAFVELLDGIKAAISIVYQVEVVSPMIDGRPFIRVYHSKFETLDSWGWNKLIQLQDVGRFIDENGGVVLRLSVRPENFCEAAVIARDQCVEFQARAKKIEKN